MFNYIVRGALFSTSCIILGRIGILTSLFLRLTLFLPLPSSLSLSLPFFLLILFLLLLNWREGPASGLWRDGRCLRARTLNQSNARILLEER